MIVSKGGILLWAVTTLWSSCFLQWLHQFGFGLLYFEYVAGGLISYFMIWVWPPLIVLLICMVTWYC